MVNIGLKLPGLRDVPFKGIMYQEVLRLEFTIIKEPTVIPGGRPVMLIMGIELFPVIVKPTPLFNGTPTVIVLGMALVRIFTTLADGFTGRLVSVEFASTVKPSG
jgi:hypothetical protein